MGIFTRQGIMPGKTLQYRQLKFGFANARDISMS
mgnify:CR=1 FL=1